MFEIKSKYGAYDEDFYTNDQGQIVVNVDLGQYVLTENKTPDYYLNPKENGPYNVDLTYDGQVINMNLENVPVDIDLSLTKTADKDTVHGNDIIKYTIDNIKNSSDVALDEFKLTDNLPQEVRLQQITTGTYNDDEFTYNVTYTTNKDSTERVIQDNLSSKTNYTIDFTSLNLAQDEYVTSFTLNYGTGKEGFNNSSPVTVTVQVQTGLDNIDEFENDATLSGKYLDATGSDTASADDIAYNNVLKVLKVSNEDNKITGDSSGTPLANAVFDILDENKDYVATITTDENGECDYKYFDLNKQYYLKEISAPAYYLIDQDMVPFEFDTEGQIINLTVKDDSVHADLQIQKQGPEEVQAGQLIEYDFPIMGDFANVDVSGFIWEEHLPEEIRLQTITTGTYNEDLDYDIEYITNKNSNWETLADNISTKENHTYNVTSEDLGLAADEHITEFQFIFGDVDSDFSEVEMPNVTALVNDDVQNNTVFENDTYVMGMFGSMRLMGSSYVDTIAYTPTDSPATDDSGGTDNKDSGGTPNNTSNTTPDQTNANGKNSNTQANGVNAETRAKSKDLPYTGE